MIKKKIIKPRLVVYYLDLRKKYKNIFCEREDYDIKDIQYFINQLYYYANQFKRKKFKIVIIPKYKGFPLLTMLRTNKPKNVKIVLRKEK